MTFSLFSNPFSTAIEDRNHTALQKCIKENWSITIPSVINREDIKSLPKESTGVGVGSAEVRREMQPARHSNTHSDRWNFPQKLELPIPAFSGAQVCAKAFGAVCLCSWRCAEGHALPKGTEGTQAGLGRRSFCLYLASSGCPDVWQGSSITGIPLCSRFLSLGHSRKTNCLV